MRTDRRGPLVAFIVVAIVAAILLVTSVRSQAAPGLRIPATTVADGPTASDVWSRPIAQVHRTVRPGLLLVHRTTSKPPVAVMAAVVRQAQVTEHAGPRRHHVVQTPSSASQPRAAAVVHAHRGHGHTGHGRHRGRQAADHGWHRHLGWTRAAVVRG